MGGTLTATFYSSNLDETSFDGVEVTRHDDSGGSIGGYVHGTETYKNRMEHLSSSRELILDQTENGRYGTGQPYVGTATVVMTTIDRHSGKKSSDFSFSSYPGESLTHDSGAAEHGDGSAAEEYNSSYTRTTEHTFGAEPEEQVAAGAQLDDL